VIVLALKENAGRGTICMFFRIIKLTGEIYLHVQALHYSLAVIQYPEASIPAEAGSTLHSDKHLLVLSKKAYLKTGHIC